jgi:type IV secretory pathway VirJ component
MKLTNETLLQKGQQTFTALVFLLLTTTAFAQGPSTNASDHFSFAGFGQVSMYAPAGTPNAVVLFLSGDGGLERRETDMARALAGEGALVACISTPHYLKAEAASHEKVFYPAGDFEELSKAVQTRAKLSTYFTPVLAGYSSGATLVYAMLAQAPAGTFAGGISLGFCPDFEFSKEPSRGSGLSSHHVTKPVPAWMLEPDPALSTPWYVLHGQMDQCCSYEATQQFTSKITKAHLIALPKVGHGYAVVKAWLPQFKDAYANLMREVQPAAVQNKTGGPQTAGTTHELMDDLKNWVLGAYSGQETAADTLAPSTLADLPLQVTEAKAGQSSDRMVVIISGDGGWKDFDQQICDGLAAQGIPVVGLNALKYFWKEKTPDAAAWDLARIMTEYGHKWGKKEVVLIGYSFGGEVLPFMFNRLPDNQKKRVVAQVLISAGDKADFTFHFTSWLDKASSSAKPLKPELDMMLHQRVMFLYGSDEDCAWVRPLAKGNFELKVLEGGHHYGGNTGKIDNAIREFIR